MNKPKSINFAVIGAGWRAELYLRIARKMPERFLAGGVMLRDRDKGRKLEQDWGVKAYYGMDELLDKVKPSFVVVSVPRAVCPGIIEELVKRSAAVLSETPPAADIECLKKLNELERPGVRSARSTKIQVAEQYIFQPLHAEILSVIKSGVLGGVTQAQVSAAHGYHGVSLIRHFLGVGFADAVISARKFISPIVKGPRRGREPSAEETGDSEQVIACMEFGSKLGIYDFTGDQYFSHIRSPRLLIRGERGEINNGIVRYLKDFRTPARMELASRYDMAQSDEIAVAGLLEKMDAYAGGGPAFYSLAEASQDRYMDLMIEESARTGKTVRTEPVFSPEIAQ